MAVIAVVPWTQARANAFRSAWIPAPPPESEPAIDRQTGMRPWSGTAAKDRWVAALRYPRGHARLAARVSERERCTRAAWSSGSERSLRDHDIATSGHAAQVAEQLELGQRGERRGD